MPPIMTIEEAVAMAQSHRARHDQRLLTPEDVRAIRAAYATGTKINVLARMYDTTWATIRDCVTRKHYADID